MRVFAGKETGILPPSSELAHRASETHLLLLLEKRTLLGESGLWVAKSVLPRFWLEKSEGGKLAGELAIVGRRQGPGGRSTSVGKCPKTLWALQGKAWPETAKGTPPKICLQKEGIPGCAAEWKGCAGRSGNALLTVVNSEVRRSW